MPIHDWSTVPDGVFHSFHVAWLGQLQDTLNTRLLPEPYYALTETVTGEAVPDVLTLQAGADPGSHPVTERTAKQGTVHDDSSEGVVALAPSPAIVQDIGSTPYDRFARRIVIRNEWEGDAVVAILEIISRGNKASRLKADQVVRKIVSFLDAGIHLLFVDLHAPTPVVPAGFHPLVCAQYGVEALPVPADRGLSAVSYQVLETSLVRSHFVPLRPGDGLPEMPAFLAPHRFVRVPLETTCRSAFQGVPRKFREVLEPPVRGSP